MSAETASSTNVIEIYVPLLNEGTDVLRPTKGRVVGKDAVEVVAATRYDPSIEEWEFPPGSRVRCTAEFRDGRTLLVARHRAD